MARVRPVATDRHEGRTKGRFSNTPARILGVFRRGRGENRVIPTNRRVKEEWIIPPGLEAGATPGEIVLAELLPRHRRYGPRPAKIIERLGKMGDARSVSLIAIHTHDIPVDFPAEAEKEADRAGPVELGHRTDLRNIPLVTIDGEDARDFDDAVFAEPAGDGFRLIIAIADVAYYVRPGSALDQVARLRGNSVYFPDRVLPMLPETLSNGWCSLNPGEDRGCLFVEVQIDAAGNKTKHRFGRGIMRSAARLTYTDLQRAYDAGRDLDPKLKALYDAFRLLLLARNARGTLELDLPERQIVLDRHGRVDRVAPRPRLDSHRLIEEFMILANIAAAEELERRHQPCVYRVHAPPSAEKLAALRGFLHMLGISLPRDDQISPRNLDRVLRRVHGTAEATLVNELILRTQSQAAYSTDNIGHFGLALPRYVHFTSPIRRYADLVVHRALIRGLQLGAGGLAVDEGTRFPDLAVHITATERRAQLAERDATDRYIAAYMSDKIGAHFIARISGVTRFALFVASTEIGASGIVPISTLPDDYWEYDQRRQALSGRHTRMVFNLAQVVQVRLAEASPVTGGLVFHVLQRMPESGKRSRPR